MTLSLDCKETPELGMDEMLRMLRDGNEEHLHYLTETLFAFARYLLISSSYNCRYPANLQGIWNGRFEPPWQSQYTININEQMNYWIAEKCNLSECMEPVIEQVKRLAVAGKSTAKELYGCRGFCVHHNTNVWDETDPEGIKRSSPFQIDGNFGVAESICEALVQSHNGYIELLPALPPEWQNGKVEGMILQGAIQADFEWKEGKLSGLTLTALNKDKEIILRYQGSNSRIVLKKKILKCKMRENAL